MVNKPDWKDAPDWAEFIVQSDVLEFGVFVASESDDCFVGWDDIEYLKPAWSIKSKRPNKKSARKELDSHYNNIATIEVPPDALISGVMLLKIDPHFVSKVCDMKGGAMEHIFKKAMRASSKGHSVTEVFEEIKLLCDRGIELEELIK